MKTFQSADTNATASTWFNLDLKIKNRPFDQIKIRFKPSNTEPCHPTSAAHVFRPAPGSGPA
jgi:hypothetical protein